MISAKIIGVLLLGMVIMVSCVTFRKSDKSTLKKINNDNTTIQKDTLSTGVLRYIHYNLNPDSTTLFLIHGAPGSSSAFIDYINTPALNKRFNMVLVDRIGYGYSDYGHYATLEKNAIALDELVVKMNLKKTVLIGHSFGGPIVARAAIKLKNKVHGTIMIAPAMDPNNEKYFWFGKFAYWKGTRWLTSKALRVSASEKYNHEKDLREVQKEWRNLKTPLLHIHGNKDGLVPFANIEYSKEHLDNSILRTSIWENKGHLIPFTEKTRMIKEIIHFIDSRLAL